MATRSLNKVLLIGNLTRDPEVRYTAGGTAVATFTVATNRNYQDSSGNNVESAEFTNCVAWAKLAEICGQLLKKGSKVFIEGRLQTSKWNDKDTGKEMRRTEVVVSDMQILSSPGGRNMDEGMDIPAQPDNNGMGENVDFGSMDLGEEEGGDSGKDDGNSTPF